MRMIWSDYFSGPNRTSQRTYDLMSIHSSIIDDLKKYINNNLHIENRWIGKLIPNSKKHFHLTREYYISDPG